MIVSTYSISLIVDAHALQEPVLMSVGWESSRVGGSTVARHEWKGLSKMAYSLEDFTEKQHIERGEQATRRVAGYRRVPGAFEEDDEED